MRVLMLTHRVPYPANKGERIRAYNWLRALAGKHSVDLLTLADEEVTHAHRQALGKPAEHVLIVPHCQWAVFWRLALGLLTGRSFTEAYFGSRCFAKTLKRLLSGGGYDACLAICSNTGAYALKVRQPQRLVVDLIDVDSAKWRLYAERHRGLRQWIYRRESNKITLLEHHLADFAMATVTVNKHECHLLNAVVPQARALAIPNGVDTEYFKPSRHHAAIHGLVFVGQMDYWPNVDAVTWFAKQVWPELSSWRRNFLGVAEAAAGHKEMAHWHLAAAVTIGKGLKAEGKGIASGTAKAIELAEEALAEMDRPK